MDTDEGKALLATANGAGVAWFLITHKAKFGTKTIDQITVFQQATMMELTHRCFSEWRTPLQRAEVQEYCVRLLCVSSTCSQLRYIFSHRDLQMKEMRYKASWAYRISKLLNRKQHRQKLYVRLNPLPRFLDMKLSL